MSKLPLSEQIHRDRMFQQGLLWCAGCKQFRPVKEFLKYSPKKKLHTNYGYRFYCGQCNQLQNVKAKEQHKQRAKRRNSTLKARFADLAGGGCQRCGYSDYYSALDFHHIYPANKEYNPTYIILTGNFEKTWKELDKCCLLCANCHNAYEAGFWRAEFIKRDGLGWTVGGSLPLDDTRYETSKPPKLQQSPLPIFTYISNRGGEQLKLFESRPMYRP